MVVNFGRRSVFQYSLKKLKVVYNDGFRLLLNEPRLCSASTLFVYHNDVPTFDALFRKLLYGKVVTVLILWLSSKLFHRWRKLFVLY